ncbi:ParA family protein [Patescibacteria group bacterium AH-259-L05]|nr:ParA family protein [Patescibacteria group bacterium AH-259-L05]
MTRPKIIVICNRKGGTGKTNIAVNLAAYLSHFGKKVLLLDIDPQANATSGLGVEGGDKGIYEVLSQEIPFVSATREVRNNLWFVPAQGNLAGADIEMVNTENREYRLSHALDEFLQENEVHHGQPFDFVLIDTPPSLGLLTVNSLVAADYTLIPVQTEYYALEGLSQLISTIHLVKENLKPSLDVLGVVLTMYDTRSRLSSEVFHEVYKNFPYRVFRTVIPRNISLAEAPSFGKTILEYAPGSKGANAYKRLAKEFLFYYS